MTASAPFGPAEQALFARELRQRLPKPEGAKWHDPYAFTTYAAQVLKKPVAFWRDLNLEDARAVMKAVRRDYPEKINPI